MTIGPGPDRPAARITADQASHVDEKFADAMRACRAVVEATPTLHHLAHYTKGGYDFSYDVLDTLPPGQATERGIYVRAGGQVSNVVRELDATLSAADTGALIRTVAHGRQGLMICDSVEPKEHVVAFSHHPTALPAPATALADLPGAQQVDSAVGELVTSLRELVSLGSQNPGSWITPKPDSPSPSDATAPPDTAAPHVERGAEPWVTSLLTGRLHPDDLQFVAYCREFKIVIAADELAHPSIGLYFKEISVDERRAFYLNLSLEFPAIVRKLGRMTSSVLGGRLDRVVLDVEKGAAYYYRIRPGEYLVGVTVDQGRVGVTDSKMAHLAVALQAQSRAAIGC